MLCESVPQEKYLATMPYTQWHFNWSGRVGQSSDQRPSSRLGQDIATLIWLSLFIGDPADDVLCRHTSLQWPWSSDTYHH